MKKLLSLFVTFIMSCVLCCCFVSAESNYSKGSLSSLKDSGEYEKVVAAANDALNNMSNKENTTINYSGLYFDFDEAYRVYSLNFRDKTLETYATNSEKYSWKIPVKNSNNEIVAYYAIEENNGRWYYTSSIFKTENYLLADFTTLSELREIAGKLNVSSEDMVKYTNGTPTLMYIKSNNVETVMPMYVDKEKISTVEANKVYSMEEFSQIITDYYYADEVPAKEGEIIGMPKSVTFNNVDTTSNFTGYFILIAFGAVIIMSIALYMIDIKRNAKKI